MLTQLIFRLVILKGERVVYKCKVILELSKMVSYYQISIVNTRRGGGGNLKFM